MLRPASSNRSKQGKTKGGKADLCLFPAADSKVANIFSHSQMTLRLFSPPVSFLHNHHWVTYTGSCLETIGLTTLLLFCVPQRCSALNTHGSLSELSCGFSVGSVSGSTVVGVRIQSVPGPGVNLWLGLESFLQSPGVSPCPGLRLNNQGSTSGQVILITGYDCSSAQGERP